MSHEEGDEKWAHPTDEAQGMFLDAINAFKYTSFELYKRVNRHGDDAESLAGFYQDKKASLNAIRDIHKRVETRTLEKVDATWAQFALSEMYNAMSAASRILDLWERTVKNERLPAYVRAGQVSKEPPAGAAIVVPVEGMTDAIETEIWASDAVNDLLLPFEYDATWFTKFKKNERRDSNGQPFVHYRDFVKSMIAEMRTGAGAEEELCGVCGGVVMP